MADFNAMANLPEELLLQVFRHLCQLGPNWDGDEGEERNKPWFVKQLPFRNSERDVQPHAGLRAYPFLGQVCKKWKDLLATPIAKTMLWQQLVIDFGHELVTSIHMPLVWSNERPNPDDYAAAFHRVSLSSSKVLDFIMQRKHAINSLVMCNSEGFWGDEGEYLNLSGKHNFQASHMGFLLGQLRNQLQELRLFNCNDMLNLDQGLWGLVALCPNMRVLSVEGLNCRISAQNASELSCLKKLESLSLIGEEHAGQWIVGLDTVPAAWSQLQALTCLELRGHHLLDTVPMWIKDMPNLRLLDVSCNNNINLVNLTAFTQLEVLVLQNLDLSQPVAQGTGAGVQISSFAKRILPNLEPLAPRLKSLSLSGNRCTRLPDCLVKLTSLEVLDLNGNKELQVLGPLTSMLAAMPNIRIMDFRGVHKERGTAYWSDAKCTTMKFLAAAAKLLKRRKYTSRVIIDRD